MMACSLIDYNKSTLIHVFLFFFPYNCPYCLMDLRTLDTTVCMKQWLSLKKGFLPHLKSNIKFEQCDSSSLKIVSKLLFCSKPYNVCTIFSISFIKPCDFTPLSCIKVYRTDFNNYCLNYTWISYTAQNI